MKKLFYLVILSLLFISVESKAQPDCWQWEPVTIEGQVMDFFILDIYFLPTNPNFGWACGQMDMIFYTTDRGKTWRTKKISINQQFHEFEHIQFLDQNNGFISGSGEIYKTTDGGDTWLDITPHDQDFYYYEGMSFIDRNNGILVGAKGFTGPGFKFCRTTNGGNSWIITKIDSVPGNENHGMEGFLTDAQMYSANGLCYALSSKLLWRSTDGGYNWNIFSVTTDTTGMYFPADYQEEFDHKGNTFLLSYANMGVNTGGARWSSDMGQTWRQSYIGKVIYGAILLDEQKGWISGEDASVYYTSDAGQNWVLSNRGINSSNSMDDIYFFDDTTGFVGGKGGLYRYVRTARLDIFGNRQICEGDTVYLEGKPNFVNYEWSNGVKSRIIRVTEPGSYWVKAYDNCNNLVYSDTIDVVFKKKASVNIVYDKNIELCEGDTLELNVNTNAFQYLWSTGQKNISRINVTSSGTYKVSAYTSDGCISRDSVQISFKPKPNPVIEVIGNTNLCTGDSVIINLKNDYPDVVWTKNGKPYKQNEKGIIVKQSGKYALVVSNNSCWSDSAFFNISVSDPPQAEIIQKDTTSEFCEGDTLKLELKTNAYTYEWSDGTKDKPYINITTSGIYHVKAYSKDGCLTIDSIEVKFKGKPAPEAELIGNKAFCEGDSAVIILKDNHREINWLKDGKIYKQDEKAIVVMESGVYTVTVRDSSSCWSDTSKFEIVVDSLPIVEITKPDTSSLCDGDTVILNVNTNAYTYEWSDGSQNKPYIEATKTGTYSIIAQSENGCITQDSIYIEFSPKPKPDPELIGSTDLCEGDSLIIFLKNDFADIIWSKNGEEYSKNTKSITVNEAGTYSVVVNNSNCWSDSISYQVTVSEKPLVDFKEQDSLRFCEGEESPISINTNAYEWEWSNGEKNTPSITVNKTGLYKVTAYSESGCSAMDSIFVEFIPKPKPVIEITGGTNLCLGDSIVLALSNDYKEIIWFKDGNLLDRNKKAIVVKQKGEYSVKVNDDTLCWSDPVEPVNISIDSNSFEILDLSLDIGKVDFSIVKCGQLSIKNIKSIPVIMQSPVLAKNIAFSIPQSQFPITFAPNETRTFDVCYSPDSLKIQIDTLILADACDTYYIPLVAEGQGGTYNTSSICEQPILVKLIDLWEKDELNTGLPQPNPSTNIVSLDFYYALDHGADPGFEINLITNYGQIIKRGKFTISETQTNSKLKLLKGIVEVNVSDIPSGTYYITINTGKNKVIHPVIVVH